MEVYQSMYYALFNKVSEAIRILQAAQCETEELFLSCEDELKPTEEGDLKKAQ